MNIEYEYNIVDLILWMNIEYDYNTVDIILWMNVTKYPAK